MPTQPPSPCCYPGCPTLLPSGGYCEQHKRAPMQAKRVYDQTTRKQDPALAEAARIRNGNQWHRVRNLFKARNPLCCDPFNDHPLGALTEAVHHVIGLADKPAMAFDWDNLRPLCTRCHNRVEGMERAGNETAHLFANSIPNACM